MKNLFAWASIGENGRIVGGKAGDQTGKEVKVGLYYYFGQDKVIRFDNKKYGRRAGKYAKTLAKCNNIGYNQAQRATLFELAKACNWEINMLKKELKHTKVNCDCSSFASTVINLAFKRQVVSCCATSTIIGELDGKPLSVISLKEATKKWHKGDMPLKEGKHIIINV